MESLSLRWFTTGTRSAESTVSFTVRPAEIARIFARWSLAGAVAITTVLVTTWAAITPSVDQILGAALWAAGFIFFALALEVGIRKIFPYVITGMALPVLAVLGMELAAEFAILAGAVIAGWLAFWIARPK